MRTCGAIIKGSFGLRHESQCVTQVDFSGGSVGSGSRSNGRCEGTETEDYCSQNGEGANVHVEGFVSSHAITMMARMIGLHKRIEPRGTGLRSSCMQSIQVPHCPECIPVLADSRSKKVNAVDCN
jgi:hypothetical protein